MPGDAGCPTSRCCSATWCCSAPARPPTDVGSRPEAARPWWGDPPSVEGLDLDLQVASASLAGMPSLAHELHLLVALMDRRADALLQRSGCELCYARFLVLLHVSDGDGMTQRDLSERLGTSEAAVSRMVAGLARDGYVDVARGAGNRRSLSLTRHGGASLHAAGGGPRRRLRPAGPQHRHRPRGARGHRAHRRHRPAAAAPPSPSRPPGGLTCTPGPCSSSATSSPRSPASSSAVYQVWRRPKGDARHRLLGRVWVVLILWTAVSSFWIRHINDGAFSWLHVLSVVTLVTVTLGVVNAEARQPARPTADNMVGSWLGACGAMVAAMAVPVPDDPDVCRRPAPRCPRLRGLGARRHRPAGGRRLPAGRRRRPPRRAHGDARAEEAPGIRA